MNPLNPFFFESSGTPLYAVYHSPKGVARGEGIVVCQPLGHEYFRCYRSIQVLCAELADHGYHVLRFDFTNSGNSGNSADAQAPGFGTWVDDIKQAVQELADICGTSTMSIIGCRIGATASLHLGGDVRLLKHLVVWDPVLDGAVFLQSLDALHDKVCQAHPAGRTAAADLLRASADERMGLELSAALRDDIGAIGPTTLMTPRARQLTAILTQDEPKPLSEVLHTEENIKVAHLDFDCGWNDAGRSTGGRTYGEVMEAIRSVFIS